MIIFLKLLPVMVSLLCIVLAFLPERSGISRPAHAEGVVISSAVQRVWRHHSEIQALAPVVTFTAGEREISAAAKQFVPEWQYAFHPGDRVRICYDRAHPERFRVCGGNRFRRAVLLTFGIGTLAAYGILWVQFI